MVHVQKHDERTEETMIQKIKTKKTAKGSYGYTISHRKWQGMKTLCYVLICVALFLLGLAVTKTYKNLLSVAAVAGALPVSKELTALYMSFRRKPMQEALYEKIHGAAKDLKVIYELNFTTYEKNYPVEAAVICGREVAGYTLDSGADTKKLEKHIKDILHNNGYDENVKIFKDEKKFLDRVRELERREKEEIPYTPHSRYPELNRDELVAYTMLAISL